MTTAPVTHRPAVCGQSHLGQGQILKGIFEAEARKIPVLSRISLERRKVDDKAFGSAH